MQDDLRSIVEALDRALSNCLAGEGARADVPALLACWARLVDRLVLALPPELRRCPSCATTAARAAAFCRRCCRTLEPLPPPASA